MWIKKIGKDYVILKDDNRNKVKIDYKNLNFKMIKPLIWWQMWKRVKSYFIIN